MKARSATAKADRDGLTFTLSAKDTAVWVLRYRFGGKARELVADYMDKAFPHHTATISKA
ncbi:MAG TPA: hypothetical protein PLG97_12985 [Alcaligenes sp.]|nr:hypothetical protein [Alcaligenes sp.]HRL28430.1 hypothetical protein [Alcaligenes sp.]